VKEKNSHWGSTGITLVSSTQGVGSGISKKTQDCSQAHKASWARLGYQSSSGAGVLLHKTLTAADDSVPDPGGDGFLGTP